MMNDVSRVRTSSPLTSQSFMVSEREALLKETLMPVYVVPEDEQLLYMYEEVKQAAATRTSSIFIRGEGTREDLWSYTHVLVSAEKNPLKQDDTVMRLCFCQCFAAW